MDITMKMMASEISEAMREAFESMASQGLSDEQYQALNSVLVTYASKYALSVLTRSVATVRHDANPDLKWVQGELDALSDEERTEKADSLLAESDELQNEIVGFAIHAISTAANAGLVMGRVGEAAHSTESVDTLYN